MKWTLSKRQYSMLQEFLSGDYMSINRAQAFDQRPFRSMLIRGWIAYTGRGFHITIEGKDAWYEFEHTVIARRNPLLPLTAYFDPTAYGLTKPAAKVRTMAKRTAA